MEKTLFKNDHIVVTSKDTCIKVVSSSGKELCIKKADNYVFSIKYDNVTVLCWKSLHPSEYFTCMRNDIGCWKEERLSVEVEEMKIVYQKELVFVEPSGFTYNKLWEVFTYDYDLNLTGRTYGITREFSYDLFVLCYNQEDRKYIVCNNRLRVFEIWKNVVKVHMPEHTPLVFRGVSSCKQVTCRIHNSTFLFSFYVMEAIRLKIIINVETMKYMALPCKQVFPLYDIVLYECYLFEGNYVINGKGSEGYLLIDNAIYDKKFNVVTVIDEHSFLAPEVSSFTILDVFEKLITIKDGWGCLRLLEISKDWKSIKEIPYRHSLGNDRLVLRVNNIRVKCIDLKTGKFIIDTNFLKSEYDNYRKRKLEADMEEDDNSYYFGGNTGYGEEGYYNISDASYREALDDDAGAYWNID